VGDRGEAFDVTWATEESGLLLACSVKIFMYRDAKSGNFQQNLRHQGEGKGAPIDQVGPAEPEQPFASVLYAARRQLHKATARSL
jgi:hypothetical protein